MKQSLLCWKCGAENSDMPMPLARLAECASCRTDLHVCRMCAYYDTSVAKSCRETVADEVRDKERANFCGYFQPGTQTYRAKAGEAALARQQLDALFGRGQGDTTSADTGPRTEAEAAREQLEKLFGTSSKNK